MNANPKTEPSSAPASDSGDVTDVDTTPMTLRIPDLIFQLRFAIRTKQFDDVERVLVAREAQLKREVEKLREISDFERLERMQMEDDLKNIKEEYEKSKRAEELYEKLMGAVKKNGLRDEEEDGTIDELRSKNRGLENELERWKNKFSELNERVLRLERDAELLMKGGNIEEKEDRKDDVRVPLVVKEEKETYDINNADSTCSRRNEDTNENKDGLGVSAGGKLGQMLDYILIDISDDDDEDDGVYTTQGALKKREVTYPSSSEAAQKKNIPVVAEDSNGILKRKFGSIVPPIQLPKIDLNAVDIDFTSTSSSDSSEGEMDQLLSSCHATDKRRKI